MRLRHTGQVVGIVTVLTFKNNGVTYQSLYAILSFLFLYIALYAFDDAHDRVSDVTVHPDRPIPRGIFTVRQVYAIGIIALCLGILSAFGLRPYQLILFFSVAILGFTVIFLKMSSILRAMLISLMIFILFPFSELSLKSVIYGLIVVLPHIAGSIVKDFLHSDGDERIGLDPPPTWARHVAGSLFIACGGVAILPIALNLVSWQYIPLIIPTIVSCVILGIRALYGKYLKVYIYGGVGMISALAAFAASA